MAADHDQTPAKLEDTSQGASRFLAEALEQLDHTKYPPYKPPSPLQLVRDYFKTATREVDNVVSQVTVTAENLSALATAVPLVAKLRIDRALKTIASVPEGKLLVDKLKDSGLPIVMENDFRYNGAALRSWVSSSSGKVKNEAYEIAVPGYSTHGRLVAFLTHELQHLNQAQSDLLFISQQKVVSPLETIWYNAAIEADAQAAAVDIAYKLKQIGKGDAWRELCNDRTASRNFTADYEAVAKRNPAAVQNGQAKRAAYDAWFDAEFRSGQKISDFYSVKGFINYGVAEQAMQSEKFATPLGAMTVNDIRKLGALSAVNYMDAPGGKPLDDKHYRSLPPLDGRAAKLIGDSHRGYQSRFFEGQNGPAQETPAVVAEPARPAKPDAAPQPQRAFKPPSPT